MNNVIASTAGRLGRLRRRTNGRLSRGQSLVEFALVLPILLLLLLVALDFGRVYLGYINVQSMARIAANYAANNPLAWGGSPNATVQTRYENQILADASATNCVLPTSGGDPVIPPPVFLDGTDAGSTTQDIGDTARVQITCTFTVITPVISSIVGGTIPVSAESNFPVKTGLSGTASGGGGGGPIVPNAAFTGDGVVSAKTAPYPMLTDSAPFVVEFRDTSGGSPTSWAWNFGDGSTSGLQDPLDHQFDCIEVDPCVYNVSMTATNGNGSSTAYMDITVLPASAVAFTANQTLISPGMSVSFTDQSTPVGTEWLWDFGDGGTSTEQNPTHTYANVGTYDVSLTVTYDPPADPPVEPLVKNAYIRVETGLCTVPRLVDLFFNSADTPFEAAGFTGSVVRGPAGPANGNFKIVAQDLTATSLAPCTSDISVVGN